ncbi:MAG: DUF1178 family protein, partial [Gluconacetobacter diazotrophicus]|nr:DUF1178 family protein [Gluconacetobacter diazotrophicus]
MILYQLGCTCGHDFESWFRDSASFDALAASKLLSCPRCAADTVSKRLMAPSVRTARAARPASPPTAAPSASTPPAGIGTPSKAPAAPVPGAPA